jgi:hypothetical protein
MLDEKCPKCGFDVEGENAHPYKEGFHNAIACKNLACDWHRPLTKAEIEKDN